MVPPQDPWRRAGPRRGARPRHLVALAADVLAREAATGLALWAAQSAAGALRLPLTLLVLVMVVVGTGRFRLTPVPAWQAAAAEGLLIFLGGQCVANLAAFLAGAPPWVAGAPA